MLVRAAYAQDAPPAAEEPSAAEPMVLRSSPLLQERMPESVRGQLPTFIFSDHSSGRPDLDTVLEGHVMLRRGDTVIRADRLEYYQPDDLAKADGHVRINRGGNVFEGPRMELRVDAFDGFFEKPHYEFLSNQSQGDAERADFLDASRAVIKNATFSTCQRVPGSDWLPDWLLSAEVLHIDTEDEVGRAENARLQFKGATLLSVSDVSFSLSDKRKSGVLPPTLGFDSTSGTTLTVPYYWNIAPNRDFTLYPTLMTSRGMDWGGQFRYLEPSYSGTLRANYMPNDALRQQDRWGASYQHVGTIDTESAIGKLGLNLNLNRVSDDRYWSDFPGGTTALTQRLLANDATLSWARNEYSVSLRTLKWQTLQDPLAPIVPPYDRLPQLAGRYFALDVPGGLDVTVDADYTAFEANRRLTGQPNAQRTFMLAQFSRPWLGAAGFITPKVQLHTRSYQFDAALSNGAQTASVTVPTFSLDSGLVFERDASLFGNAYRQTLEPRLFYVNTPFVAQNYLPNYDSGANDFNFASIYSENAFGGNDRIADNNLLTAGVTTRLLNGETGAEAARFGIAQRYRYADQNITLPQGTPDKAGLSDVLLGASVNLDSRWALESTVQYNPNMNSSTRTTVGARYNPGHYRVISMAYRYQRDLSEQADIGWQWPLNDLWGDKGQDLGPGRGQGSGRWYSVGRLNYSLRDGQLVDSLIGFEYDAGCWLGRIVLERQSTGLVSTNQRIMFQLEFVGFSRVGIDPLSTLKNSIPRYQYLREQTSPPSRFSNYD